MRIYSGILIIQSFVINVLSAQTGNSLVTCAACQGLQAQIDNWSCDINCQVAKGSSGKLSVADPGFPRGGAQTPRRRRGGGANIGICQIFPKTA